MLEVSFAGGSLSRYTLQPFDEMHADIATRYPDEIGYWSTYDAAYVTCHIKRCHEPSRRDHTLGASRIRCRPRAPKRASVRNYVHVTRPCIRLPTDLLAGSSHNKLLFYWHTRSTDLSPIYTVAAQVFRTWVCSHTSRSLVSHASATVHTLSLSNWFQHCSDVKASGGSRMFSLVIELFSVV